MLENFEEKSSPDLAIIMHAFSWTPLELPVFASEGCPQGQTAL
jgi:hypothetical protein